MSDDLGQGHDAMISLLGSVKDGCDIATSFIEDALSHPQALQHNSSFTGRPATQLFVTDTHVAKLRSDFVFQKKDIEKRGLAALAMDRQLGAYHPEKTWFVWSNEDQILIGNIAPRLTTFHNSLPELIKTDSERTIRQLSRLLELYFSVASKTQFRLDEGLSNFGWDDRDTVFYLDDDRYQWDHFTSFASILAVWIRQLESFQVAHATVIAENLADILLTVFNSRHKLQVLLGQLRHSMTVGEREQACIAEIMSVLNRSAYSKKTSQTLLTSAHLQAGIDPGQPVAAPTPASGVAEPTRVTQGEVFAVLADVHANLPALEAVLSDLEAQGVNRLLVLGDIVGYGPYPRECIALLRTKSAVIIQGNHDYAAASGDVSVGFSKLARWAIEWTRGVLQESDSQWLTNLPPVHHCGDWMAVHGAPMDKNYFYGYVYHMTYEANLDWLAEHREFLAFHGHSHIAGVYTRSKKGDHRDEARSQDFSSAMHVLACPGAVGQPRSGSTDAEYAIYNTATRSFQLRSVPYDYQQTINAMRDRQFPAALYERLALGR